MRISPERLEHAAESTGFKADVLEKAALLLGGLEAICNHPALKGGTASNPSLFSNGRHSTCSAIKDHEMLISGSLVHSHFVWKNQAHSEEYPRQRSSLDAFRHTIPNRLAYFLE